MTRTIRTSPARLALRFLVVLALCIGVGAQPQRAEAANMSAFDPGYIISDFVFYDDSAMSAGGIQSFLSAKGASCVPADDGTACLKDYRQSTVDRAADDRCRGAYVGASDETAATIIAKVAQACDINPRVLLVTLQKEQSLVTRTKAGADSVYRKAMGFGCPDTAACDSRYYGFFNQVYSAAWQFRSYALNPSKFNHRAGAVNEIRFHPNAACGTSSVLIRNQATASLYNYTPYQPNAAALAAGYGTGDSCSSYGNRNFWGYFTDWFGSTYSPDPVGFLDSASVTGANTLHLSGWALDPDTTDPIRVDVWMDGGAYGVMANTTRTDIGAAYPGWGDNHGWALDLPVRDGVHTACAYAINQPAGTNPKIGCATVNVVNTQPRGQVDSVTTTASSVRVSGWAWDPDTTAPVDVHVYAGNQIIGIVKADQARPDVGGAFPGAGGSRGFSGEFPVAAGVSQVCAYAINAPSGGNPSLGCARAEVVNATPIGFVDRAAGTASTIQVSGWAWDADAGAPIQVHVYVDGAFAGLAMTSLSRPDVNSGLKTTVTTGYGLEVPAAAGTHQVCVYAINAPSGHNPGLGCVSGVRVG